MSKAKQKQLQALKQQKQKRQSQYRIALKKIIESEQTLRISLDFAEEYLNLPINEPLQEYSPILISRMVFQKQLQQIKKQFEKLPSGQGKIQHFIVIMIRVMKFPFEKIPLYMIGLKDMFYEIVQQSKQTIGYDKIFKYIVGELVTLKQQQQNTEFQVNFQQNKKQDYLLHDNGIKRTLYTHDLKVVMSLDEKQNCIKFYDQQMRNINRYNGKKQNHNGKNPLIIDFDYSQMTMRLGVIYPDNIIESIHLPNYLNKNQNQFEQSSLNLLSLQTLCKMRRVFYMHMLNKWLTISDQGNKLYLYDMEKVRSKPEQVEEKLNIDHNGLNITIVMEIISISTVCFVAGNQITFYNESLTQKKFTKFSHHQTINILRYNEENNTFYLVGIQQKVITMFTINRNHSSFKIKTFSVNKIITDIEIFPFFDALLVTDQTHEMRLIHQPSKNVYQHQSLSNIVKMKDKFIKIQKTSRSSFIVFQTYMLNFTLDKVAIEKEIQYNFLPNYYFDSRKDQMYISVNSQIISFSLIYGEIRKNYSLDTSNIIKHQCFFIGPKTLPFIYDQNNYIYQVYLKSELMEGQNKNYKKKILMREIVSYFYDDQMRTIMLINDNSLSLIRNDFNNNFNAINNVYFDGLAKIANCTFCKKTKYLTLMTVDQSIYQFRNYDNHFSKCFKFSFFRALNEAQQKIIIQYQYCSHYQLLILLNNRNQIVLVQRLNISNYVIISIVDHLPYKLKSLVFNKFTYHLIKQKNINLPSILLIDDSGFIIDINLQKIIVSKFINAKKEENAIKKFIGESYQMKAESVIVEKMIFNPEAKIRLNSSQFILQKAHEKPIVIASKIFLQIPTILTISKDGVIKLWNQKYAILFVLKIPTLLKLTWNMEEIQNIKNSKSIKELKKIINHHYSLKNHHPQFYESISKNKKFKSYVQPVKKFKFAEDIPLQIESKQLQDLVLHEQDYRKNFQTSRAMKTKLRYNPELSNTIDVHPWRNRRQFVKILQKASPPHKYHAKTPKDLLTLRTSLDMTEKKKKIPNYKTAQTILPQLKLYQNQKKQNKQEAKNQKQKDDQQNFQSCLYIKTQRRTKKPNQFDRIDREFLRKQIALQNRRRVPRVGHEKINSSIQLGESTSLLVDQNRFDTIRDIQTVFQEHNKECTQLGKGRIIQIAKINLIKDYI